MTPEEVIALLQVIARQQVQISRLEAELATRPAASASPDSTQGAP
jgi:hypothetical protein